MNFRTTNFSHDTCDIVLKMKNFLVSQVESLPIGGIENTRSKYSKRERESDHKQMELKSNNVTMVFSFSDNFFNWVKSLVS